MITENQIRHQLVRKIRRIPSDKLNDLADYLNKLEQSVEKSAKVMSFAGSWSNIEDNTFDDLTKNLIENRNKNTRRFNE